MPLTDFNYKTIQITNINIINIQIYKGIVKIMLIVHFCKDRTQVHKFLEYKKIFEEPSER